MIIIKLIIIELKFILSVLNLISINENVMVLLMLLLVNKLCIDY